MSMFRACFFGRSWKSTALAAVLLAAVAPAVGQTPDPLPPAWLIRVSGPSNAVAWCAVAAKKEQAQNLSLPNDSIVCLLRTTERNNITFSAREKTNSIIDNVLKKDVVADEIIRQLFTELDGNQYGNYYQDYVSNQDELVRKITHKNHIINSPIIEIKLNSKLESAEQKTNFLSTAKEIADGTGKFLIGQKIEQNLVELKKSTKQYQEEKLIQDNIKSLRNNVALMAQSLKKSYEMLEIIDIDQGKLNDSIHLLEVTGLQLNAINDCYFGVKKCNGDSNIYIYIASALISLAAIAVFGFFVKNYWHRRGSNSVKRIESGGSSPQTQPKPDRQAIVSPTVRSEDARKNRDIQLISEYAQRICEAYNNNNSSYNNANLFDNTLEVIGKLHSFRMELDRIMPSFSRNDTTSSFDVLASINYVRNKLEQSDQSLSKLRHELEEANERNRTYQNYNSRLNTALVPLTSCLSPIMDGIDIYNNDFSPNLERISTEDQFRREIRLTLSAISVAWNRLYIDVSPDLLGKFEEIFNLDKIKTGIESMRLMLDTMPYNGDIWSDCLSTGFTNDWINYLFRADALLFYYFEDAEEIPKLSGVTRFTAEAFRLIFEAAGVVLDKVYIGKLPKREYVVASFSDEKLLRIHLIRDSQSRLRHKLDGKVVDVISYGYKSIDGVYHPSKVAIFNPSALDSAPFTAGE